LQAGPKRGGHWRTINGEEASAYYAAGTAQYHINADIMYALRKYVAATGDDEFLAHEGAEILVETARLWADHAGNVEDGCHIAAIGGSWMIPIYGLASMRDDNGHLSFQPHLPHIVRRLRFPLSTTAKRRVTTRNRLGSPPSDLAVLE